MGVVWTKDSEDGQKGGGTGGRQVGNTLERADADRVSEGGSVAAVPCGQGEGTLVGKAPGPGRNPVPQFPHRHVGRDSSTWVTELSEM